MPKIREEVLYPRIANFLKRNMDCKWVAIRRGPEDVGQVDVIGVRLLRGKYSDRYEVIGVEVKPKTFHFGKKIGQAIGYSLLAHRVYLACREEFTTPQVELASRLGVGLIEVKRRAGCEEIIGSRVFEPDKEKMLSLLSSMDLAECMFCGSLINEYETRNLTRAIDENKAYYFIKKIKSKDMLTFKGEKKETNQYLFLCPSCVKLFGKFKQTR